MAISEKAVSDAEKLAISEINAAGGILGKQIVFVEEDGASEPSTFATKAEKLIDGEKVGVLCALHPANRSKLDKTAAAVCFEIDLGDFSAINASAIAFREPSTQQSTYYDLSIVIPENIKYSDIAACWETLGLSELESARVIDTYEKLGFRSITVRLVFAAMDRTLEMEEVQGWIDEILANLGKIGVTLRT